jgi:hypothetical protein
MSSNHDRATSRRLGVEVGPLCGGGLRRLESPYTIPADSTQFWVNRPGLSGDSTT